jgi:hypothetical protein
LENILVIPYLSPEFITALMEIFEPKQVTNKYLSNEERMQKAETYHECDADLSLIQQTNHAIIGYRSQGHAHALNLEDSGVRTCVGLPATSRSIDKVTGSSAVQEAPVSLYGEEELAGPPRVATPTKRGERISSLDC